MMGTKLTEGCSKAQCLAPFNSMSTSVKQAGLLGSLTKFAEDTKISQQSELLRGCGTPSPEPPQARGVVGSTADGIQP